MEACGLMFLPSNDSCNHQQEWRPHPPGDEGHDLCLTSVFVKAQIQPNTGKCDPHAVHYDSVLGVYVGHILALTKTVDRSKSYSLNVEQMPDQMEAGIHTNKYSD
jgi:hypothetical protein